MPAKTFNVTAVVQPIAGYTGSNVPTGYVNILVCGGNSNGNDGCEGGLPPSTRRCGRADRRRWRVPRHLHVHGRLHR